MNSEITEPLFVYADSLPYNATRLVRYRYNNANAPRGSNGIALINTVGNSKNIHAFITGEGRTIAYSVKKENGWGEWAFFVPSSDLTPTAMTTTRTENPYISTTAFNRIVAKKIGPNLLWVLFNVWIDLTPLPNSDDIVEIGKVNGISGVPFGNLFNIPAQNGSGTILLDFSDNGVFKIINQSGNPVSGFVRTSFVAVVDFT